MLFIRRFGLHIQVLLWHQSKFASRRSYNLHQGRIEVLHSQMRGIRSVCYESTSCMFYDVYLCNRCQAFVMWRPQWTKCIWRKLVGYVLNSLRTLISHSFSHKCIFLQSCMHSRIWLCVWVNTHNLTLAHTLSHTIRMQIRSRFTTALRGINSIPRMRLSSPFPPGCHGFEVPPSLFINPFLCQMHVRWCKNSSEDSGVGKKFNR